MNRRTAVVPAALLNLLLSAAIYAILLLSKGSAFRLEMRSNRSENHISRPMIPGVQSSNFAPPSYHGATVEPRSCSMNSYSLTWGESSSCPLPSSSGSSTVRRAENSQVLLISGRRSPGSRIGLTCSVNLSSVWYICPFLCLPHHHQHLLDLRDHLKCRQTTRHPQLAMLWRQSLDLSQEPRQRNGDPRRAADAVKLDIPVSSICLNCRANLTDA